MTKRQRDRERINRLRLVRQLRIAADESAPPGRRKKAARYAAALAERLGILERPRRCQKCGRGRRLERHHPDHVEPLRVEFCCHSCHEAADRAARLTRAARTIA